jgi:hypothetical protein
MSFPQPGLELAESIISMSIEIVKVADAVFTEKRTSHGSMKSTRRLVRKCCWCNPRRGTYFHNSPFEQLVSNRGGRGAADRLLQKRLFLKGDGTSGVSQVLY